jgi:cbb3-type cytochrome oxidase subunit 1
MEGSSSGALRSFVRRIRPNMIWSRNSAIQQFSNSAIQQALRSIRLLQYDSWLILDTVASECRGLTDDDRSCVVQEVAVLVGSPWKTRPLTLLWLLRLSRNRFFFLLFDGYYYCTTHLTIPVLYTLREVRCPIVFGPTRCMLLPVKFKFGDRALPLIQDAERTTTYYPIYKVGYSPIFPSIPLGPTYKFYESLQQSVRLGSCWTPLRLGRGRILEIL